MTRRGDQIAVVQAAVDLQKAAKEIDALLSKIRTGEETIRKSVKVITDSRYQMGVLFLEVRKGIPDSGPKAGRWSEFVKARGISHDTALRYMKLAQYIAANPGALEKSTAEVYDAMGMIGWGKIGPEIPRTSASNPAPSLSAAELPPPTETPALPAPATPPTKSAKPPTRVIRDRDSGGDYEGAQEEYEDGLGERQLDEGGERIPLFPREPAAEALRGKPTAPPPKPAPVQPEFEWPKFSDDVATYIGLWEEECPPLLYPDLGDLLIAEGNRLKGVGA